MSDEPKLILVRKRGGWFKFRAYRAYLDIAQEVVWVRPLILGGTIWYWKEDIEVVDE